MAGFIMDRQTTWFVIMKLLLWTSPLQVASREACHAEEGAVLWRTMHVEIATSQRSSLGLPYGRWLDHIRSVDSGTGWPVCEPQRLVPHGAVHVAKPRCQQEWLHAQVADPDIKKAGFVTKWLGYGAQSLGPVQRKDGTTAERKIETWLPKKKVKAYSLRCLSLSPRLLGRAHMLRRTAPWRTLQSRLQATQE